MSARRNARDRDVAVFDARAGDYEQGWLGRWHAGVVGATADLAVALAPDARMIVDIGCGTGLLLRTLARRLPHVIELVGVDPSDAMLTTARNSTPAGEDRVRYLLGVAEALPLQSGTADLVVSTTSFDHWANQADGLRECRRMLKPGGQLILTDLISPILWPTTVAGRRGKARTPSQIGRLLVAAGFTIQGSQKTSTLIRTIHASKERD